MPYCNDCGSQVSDTASFCTECGSKLTAGVSVGQKVDAGSSCPSCGISGRVRWSLLNKTWICDNCGHSSSTSGGFASQKHELDERSTYSKLTAGVSGGHRVDARSSCPLCGSIGKVRWSVMNKSWICDDCGHSWGMLSSV